MLPIILSQTWKAETPLEALVLLGLLIFMLALMGNLIWHDWQDERNLRRIGRR